MSTGTTDARAVRCFVALRRSTLDLRRSVAFYCDGLGFTVAHGRWTHERALLSLGEQTIELIANNEGTASAPGVFGPDIRFQHAAIVASDMDAAFTRLDRLAPVAISRGGPQRLPESSGGVTAFKFRDPDGHPLELIEFPTGHDAARWQAAARRGRGPTLGIDHAAISVSDVEKAIAFYERLGFRIASRQLNQGEQQARLDGLARARVEVVGLIPAQPGSPHLELLGYLEPPAVIAMRPDGDRADLLVWSERTAAEPASLALLDGRREIVVDPDGHRHGVVAG